MFEQGSQIVGAMQRAGVSLLAGTDVAWYQPYAYAGFSLHDELGLLVDAGLTPTQAIQSATIAPARFLGMERDVGSIEKRKLADLVLLSADPLQNITDTRKIEFVIINGRLLDRRELDSLLAAGENSVKNK